jgi:hypothetical protein
MSGRLKSSRLLEVRRAKIVPAAASANINLRSRSAYLVTVRVKSVQQTRLIQLDAGLDPRKRILAYKECRLDRTIVAPKPHSASRRIIRTAVVWKINHVRARFCRSTVTLIGTKMALGRSRRAAAATISCRTRSIRSTCAASLRATGRPTLKTTHGSTSLNSPVRLLVRYYSGNCEWIPASNGRIWERSCSQMLVSSRSQNRQVLP